MFVRISWFITALASAAALLVLWGGLASANGAPQEAAIAGIAIACVAIPYIFTRSIEGIVRKAAPPPSAQSSEPPSGQT